MKIADRQVKDRPREKMARYGAEKLSDLELLMAIIGSGNKQADVTKIARDVSKLLKAEREISFENIVKITGIGMAKVTELVASFELAKSYLLPGTIFR